MVIGVRRRDIDGDEWQMGKADTAMREQKRTGEKKERERSE